MTLIDAIIEGLSSATRCSGSEVPPAAVLCTDAKSEWLPLMETLRRRLPQLLIYGEYDPQNLVGPAIWLKCAMEPTALAAGRTSAGNADKPEASASDANGPEPTALAAGRTSAGNATAPEASAFGSGGQQIPIIYLPGVSRQDLRAGSQCPRLLQPIVELLYRGAVWTQKNGRDWTVEALLVSKDRPGLGLDVAGDKGTRLSMMASLSVLADTPASRLQGRRLNGARGGLYQAGPR